MEGKMNPKEEKILVTKTNKKNWSFCLCVIVGSGGCFGQRKKT